VRLVTFSSINEICGNYKCLISRMITCSYILVMDNTFSISGWRDCLLFFLFFLHGCCNFVMHLVRCAHDHICRWTDFVTFICFIWWIFFYITNFYNAKIFFNLAIKNIKCRWWFLQFRGIFFYPLRWWCLKCILRLLRFKSVYFEISGRASFCKLCIIILLAF